MNLSNFIPKRNTLYNLYKLLDDDRLELCDCGHPYTNVVVGERMRMCYLTTSIVRNIERIGKGIKFETENSIYILEEVV